MTLKLRKLICAAVAALCVCAAGADARVQPHALGLRFTGGNILGGEFNYQKAAHVFGSKRLEIGASIWGDDNSFSIGVAAVPQWHWNISPRAANGGFNWYAGPGAAVGLNSYAEVKDSTGRVVKKGGNGVYLGIGGQIGIEYDFNAVGAPLNLSIDSRPMIDLLNRGGISLGGIIYGACLALRYTF